jgi:excinuclease UvrABC ATPase subunit
MGNQVSVSELLKEAGQLSIGEFEEFFNEIQFLRSKKVPLTLSKDEDKLLKQINSGLQPNKQFRLNYLIARRDTRSITESERIELLNLTEEIEKNDVIRLKKIAKLAELKGVGLNDVVRIFNIKPYQHE